MPFRRRRRTPRRTTWDDDFGYGPYVSSAERRDRARAATDVLRKTKRTLWPVALASRSIAATFWGKAWCENLERYSDYANRLPRGRAYLREGSVLDLQIAAGQVAALVSGTEIYKVVVRVTPVKAGRWEDIRRQCAGEIDSVVDLLRGQLSERVMAHLCRQQAGLFPTPREIRFSCTCPDAASLCKHVAAVLYGIGARFDEKPELLFRLRGVDEQELIASAIGGVPLAAKLPPPRKLLKGDLKEVFGVEIAEEDTE